MKLNPLGIRVLTPTGQETALDQRKYFTIGLAVTALGLLTTVAGFMFAHFTGLDPLDNIGREIYPSIPRGWYWELAGQSVAVGGVLLALGGLTLAFLFRRDMTWARAALGAALFTGLMIILYGIIPNQWLSLAQGELGFSSAKKLPAFPRWLVLNNEVAISYATLKEAILGGYVANLTAVLVVVIYQYQVREKKRRTGPPPKPVSAYGRPLTKTRSR
jgi:hypothetical protein